MNTKKKILTGDRPTGMLHIGHLIGSLQNRVRLQHEYDQFVIVANVQALTDNFDNPEKVKESIAKLLCDYYAVGIDYNISTVFIQSEVPQIHEIFIYLANFVTIQQISHNPTIKTEIAEKKFDSATPLGFYIYPIHQVADITCVNGDLVPVGPDQAPMVESTREIVRRFNNAYNVRALKEPEALFGVTKNLPGTDGHGKMSKSLGNCIYLSDTEEELKKKIKSMKTDPNRIRATDKGTIKGNTVFIYHDIFNPDKAEIHELKVRYKLGKVGDVEVKDKLFKAMNTVLTPIREKRKEAESKKQELVDIAIEGSRKVSKIAQGIVDQMKDAMQIRF
jgi:tryptophanyl-tRNA synthetase